MEQYKPLKGVKVVELSLMVASASCGRMMADWGADVIKLENTKGGDNFRKWPLSIGAPADDDFDPIFDNLNANKRAVSIDTRTKEGQEIVYRLLEDADVFLTNLRTEALGKQGLDYDTLKEKFPKLVMCQLDGYGPKGEEAGRPGYDNTAFWARGGFMYSQAVYGDSNDTYPVYMPMGFGDTTCALGMMAATVSAVLSAKQTGKGDRVSSSLYGTALWCFHIMSVATEERYGYQYPKTREVSAPTGAPFRTKDNQWVMTTILKIEEQWPVLCNVLGVPELGTDPRYNTSLRQRDPEVRKYLMKRFEEIYATKTADEWCKLLTEADIVNDKLAHYKDMEHSEQAWENEYIHEVTCPNGGKSILVRPAMRSDRMGIPTWKRGPMLGEHTEEVLKEIGYTDEQIKAMEEKKAAVQIDTTQFKHLDEEM